MLTRTRPRPMTLALLAACLLVVSACGGGSSDSQVASLEQDTAGPTTAQTPDAGATDADREQAMLDFAQCMRDQGLDFPDPQPGPDGQLGFRFSAGPDGQDGDGAAGPGDTEDLREASRACRDHMEDLPPPEGSRTRGAMDEEAFLEYAQCMREEGISEFPDPGPNGVPDPEAMQQLDLQDPDFQDAAQTCAEQTDVGRFGGGGGSAGGGGGPSDRARGQD